MNNLQNLVIKNKDFDLDSGFFWVEFENGKSLQCCLKGNWDEEGGGLQYYDAAVELDNNGFDDGICLEVNDWAKDEDGEIGHINDFIIEQAREIGLQIVA